MRAWLRHWDLVVASAAAAALSAAAPLVLLYWRDAHPAATGRVRSFEAGSSISLETARELRGFRVRPETKVEGLPLVGKTVDVWEDEGTATQVKVRD